MQLVYSEEELFSDLDFASLHEISGQRLHGGLDANGKYLPPRANMRVKAIQAWTKALEERGGKVFEADASLLTGPRVPNVAQQCLLIGEGLDQPFWNTLTITGKIEGRGRVLADIKFPDLQKIVKEDISEMAIGHLNKGLLATHGIDEGGSPESDIGGHDVMWFVARDLAFGEDAYPDVEPPGNIARPESDKRWMPQLAQEYEGMLSFLMNLLMIEFRAENGFADTQRVFKAPTLFSRRRQQAELGAEIIERIRSDEEIHVLSLRLYLGELRSLTLIGASGEEISGAALIDPFWDGLVQWATLEQPVLAARDAHTSLVKRISAHEDGDRILERFIALGDLEV